LQKYDAPAKEEEQQAEGKTISIISLCICLFLAMKAAGIKFSGSQLKTSSGQVLKLTTAGSSPTKMMTTQKVIAIQRSGGGGTGPQVMKLVRTAQGAVLSPSGASVGAGAQVLKVVSTGASKGGVQVVVGII
jgi:hypothetical protein